MAAPRDPISSDAEPFSERGRTAIPDHELLRLIGRGSYGEVWLARNSLGTYRAVKIVYEKSFRDRRPFEREFKGVQKFEPLSRLHDNLVDVLHVGRNDAAGYFYCVMEVADDAVSAQAITPEDYTPRSLAYDMARHKRLSFEECQRVGAGIASALAFLHAHELIHRDVKPSNIVFVNGVPKLADIGLVADLADAKSYVGTEGFIPPEGPGTVQADIYSLGKVLYEISTGKDRRDYPDLPTYLGNTVEKQDLIELNRVIWKACRTEPHQRYKSAKAMATHLTALDRSPRARFRKRARASLIASAKIAAVLACLAGAAVWYHHHTAPPFIRLPADFTPVSGSPGSKLTIAGTGFSPVPGENLVQFGAVRGEVVSVTPSNLVATVPPGATCASVWVATTGRVTYAQTPFLPTFESAGGWLSVSNFGPRIDLPTRPGPNFLAVADFDGDGWTDIAVAEYASNTFAIYRNTGAKDGGLSERSFAGPVIFPFGPGLDIPYRIGAGDVDGDGRIDLLVPNRQSLLMIYRNVATPGVLTTNSFAPPVAFFTALDQRTTVVHDLDGDKRPDIVGAANGTSQIAILRNTGVAGELNENSFATVMNLSAASNPNDLCVADLDGDGKPDIVAVNSGGTVLSLYRNVSVPGKLTFDSFEQFDLPAPYNSVTVAVGDMDGDGRMDIVTGSHDPQRTNRVVTVWRNVSKPGSLSASSFARGVHFAVPGWANNVALGDLTGDGKPDIAVSTQLPSHVEVFENRSTPGVFNRFSLAPSIQLTTLSNATGIVIADLSNDGRPEIIFGNAYDATVSVYPNLTPLKSQTAGSE